MSDTHSLPHAYPQAERDAIYKAIRQRRDMRHFQPNSSMAPEQLQRLLEAAHWGPSVGYMQPWRFIRISQSATRLALAELVEQERQATAQAMGERQADFLRLKVEGLHDAAEVLVVCLMPGREQHIFGRRTLPEMDIASVGCALQNLWLAARAEGLGMGWVSFFEPQVVAQLLALPEGAHPLAIVCLGPVPAFYDAPMLEQERWAQRLPLAQVVFEERWGQASPMLSSATPRP